MSEITEEQRLRNTLANLTRYIRVVVLPKYHDPTLENMTALAEHVLKVGKRITFTTCTGCRDGWCFMDDDMCVPDEDAIDHSDQKTFLCAFYGTADCEPKWYLLTQTEFDILDHNLPSGQRIRRVEEAV